MHLDTLTLMAAGSFIAAVSGALLAGAWTQIRSAPALLWWAAAQAVNALGIALLLYGMNAAAVPALGIGAWIAATSPALTWAGARIFNRKSVPIAFLVAGSILGLLVPPVASLLPSEGGPQAASILVSFVCWLIYLLAAAFELWRGRAEPLKARWPLIGFLLIHVSIFVGGIYDLIFGGLLDTATPPLNSWFGAINFESLVYSIGVAIFMVVMCKERTELQYKTAAYVDVLTGSATRGAFFERAEGLMRRCLKDGAPLSVVIFDLDRFKSINDTHGHAVGDRVLLLFADTVRSMLRPNDLIGRHGGEEFAVVLPGATIETAYVIADRVRHAFAESCRLLDQLQLYATVSAGVAAAAPEAGFLGAMEAADRAMYRAKNLGRNRVERADGDGPAEAAKIIRLA